MIIENEQQFVPNGRLASVDALRGFDMFWITGGGYFFNSFAKVWPNGVTETVRTQLEHVPWEGFHFLDVIFALFLFIVGVVLPFSISSRLEKGRSRGQIYFHVFKRAAVLIFLGLVFNELLKFDFANMRWTGVL